MTRNPAVTPSTNSSGESDKEKAAVTHLHRRTFGVEHAGAKRLVPVVEADDVEADGLGYGEDQGQHPYGQDLKDSQQGDPHPLDSAPGGHRPVPVQDGHVVRGQRSTHSSLLEKQFKNVDVSMKNIFKNRWVWTAVIVKPAEEIC